MRVLSLRAHGFRNLDEVNIELHPRLNVFTGPNGVGKTNLLEALHLSAALRPLRQTGHARELIRFDLERGKVSCTVDLDGELPIEVMLEPRGRKATLAGKAVRDVGEVAARIGLVCFTPEDLAIVRQGPDVRRRALDRFAFGLAPTFLAKARAYEAALSRRNKLLKAWPVDPEQVEVYTEPLILAGAELIQARVEAVRGWNPDFAEAAHRISRGQLKARLGYRNVLLSEGQQFGTVEMPPLADLQALLHAKLEDLHPTELERKTTLAGPHLDDMLIEMNGKRARHLASQGQARALVLALKMAEVRTVAARRESPPLLLLDDVAGELDPARAEALFETALEVGAQTFVTCTHLDALPAGLGGSSSAAPTDAEEPPSPEPSGRQFEVEEGRVLRTHEISGGPA